MTGNFLLRRLISIIPVLFGVTLITFLIFNVAGGDASLQLAGRHATPEQVESIRESLGLNKPLLQQYFIFVRQSVALDWGHSWQTNENINSMLLRGVGPSLSLTLPAFLLTVFFSLGLALIITRYQNSWIDHSVVITCLAMMSVSFLVYIILYQYYFAFSLGLFPVNGWDSSWIGRWSYLVLPWIISISVSLGPNILLYRSALVDETRKDYVVTGKAKGLSDFLLYSRHILQNALIPLITLIMIQIPFLVTGSLLLEAFFGIPGLGGVLIQAIRNADFPVIKAITVMGSFIYIFFNFLTDVIYQWIDPRVRLS